ncbi:MAG: 3-hydroxyacyl-ACP dehydratase FabZ [Verrucomicrobia bacterium]|nr:3-hydroxyacyl-ACP dehydratase FabZ [Verrucomicrobiota bacterium]
MASMDIDEIKRILPHRYPMLLVDRVLECDDDLHIVGIKNVTANEPFFQGHFPESPVMPGVLQLEAMAQTGGILLLRKIGGRGTPYFMSIDKVKFRKVVKPGDQMRIEVEITKMRATSGKFAARILVDGAVVSQAELMCMVAIETDES